MMDKDTAINELVPGQEVAYIARCIDTLLQSDYAEASIFPKLVPFLGQNLLDRNIIEYSQEPGVDVTDRYFVLWEPFLRAKTALLIGTVIEKCKEVPDMTEIVDLLVGLFNGEEEIERAFSLLALANIGQRKPDAILPVFPKVAAGLTQIVSLASSPSKPFCLFHSPPFQSQVFESFLDFVNIPGLLDNPEYVQRLVEANITLAVIQIALTFHVYLPKKPIILWNLLWVFLRIVTEHPQGIKMWDLDHIPRNDVDVCIAMRIALTGGIERAAQIRNAFVKIPSEERNLESFGKFVQSLQK